MLIILIALFIIKGQIYWICLNNLLDIKHFCIKEYYCLKYIQYLIKPLIFNLFFLIILIKKSNLKLLCKNFRYIFWIDLFSILHPCWMKHIIKNLNYFNLQFRFIRLPLSLFYCYFLAWFFRIFSSQISYTFII
jgi:hypothetical protein